MDKGFIPKSPLLFRVIRGSVCFILLASLILPVFAYASGAPYPASIYEPYRIKRNLEHIFIDNPSDYYSYLLGDKLNPLNFYIAYRYFQGKPLNSKQISDIEKIYKSNGNYVGGNDPSNWESEKYFEEWKKERNSIMQDGFAYGQEKNSDDYNSYQSNVVLGSEICPFGTFENATKILREKKKNLSNEELKTWIQNQDKIFLNCFESWNSWSNRAWRADPVQITCDDNKLQGLKVVTEEERKDGKGFFAWIKSWFVDDKEESALTPSPMPSQSAYYPQFASSGSAELRQDEEMQNALYYYYKAKKEYLCSNIASDLFKKISDDLENPHHANATIGYIRSKARDGNPANVEKINEYLSRKDLVEIKDPLLIEKEKLLSSVYNEPEFIKSQKGLENPSANFIHDAAIFRQQYSILSESGKENLLDASILDKHSEFARFVYYWNFKKPDNQWLLRIESEYKRSVMSNLWLVLLLREPVLNQKYVDAGLAIASSSKLYYPIYFYALQGLMEKDKNRSVSLTKNSLNQPVPDIAYNYFADLIMRNVATLDEAVEFMDRKATYLKFLDTIDYSYVRSKNRTLSSMLNEAGWKDEETGATYYYKFRDQSIEKPIDDQILTFINWGLPIDRLYANQKIRERFKGEIFTRAFMLDRKDIYRPLLKELSVSDGLLAKANSSENEVTQKFLIAYAIMKGLDNGKEDKYGIAIHNQNYNYGANAAGSNLDDWSGECNYCQDDYIHEEDNNKTEQQLFSQNPRTVILSKFLSDKEIINNREEKDRLFEESLVKIFAEPVLAYMEVNPRDVRIPEALSLIIHKVRRWHYRESDGDWTHKVFQTLQYKYPKSSWAKDTPVYW